MKIIFSNKGRVTLRFFIILFVFILIVFLVVFLVRLSSKCTSKGTGTINDPFIVCTVSDLKNINNNLDKHFVQGKDLDFLKEEIIFFEPIGSRENKFSGTYDGKKHKILNLNIDSKDLDFIALFAYVDKGAIIKNTVLENANISGKESVGALVGHNQGEVINNKVNATVSGFGSMIGILVGSNEGKINNNSIKGKASANTDMKVSVGGIVGQNEEKGIILKNKINVEVNGFYNVGGVVGTNFGEVKDNTFSGKVFGKNKVGGITGYNLGKIINNSVDAEIVGLNIAIGGVVGENNCFALKHIKTRAVSDEINNSCIISNNNTKGKVSGTDYVGCVIGLSYSVKQIDNNNAQNKTECGNCLNNGCPIGGLKE